MPDLEIAAIKAKIDTGARTSAIHAFKVERYRNGGAPWARLYIHPRQRNESKVVTGDVAVIEERKVTDSGGHDEMRIVIATTLAVGGQSWPIEVTVTDRDPMRFRLLLGRTALHGRATVDPARSYLLGRKTTANLSTTRGD